MADRPAVRESRPTRVPWQPRMLPPTRIRLAPTVIGVEPSGPSACAVPVVPKRIAAIRTWVRAMQDCCTIPQSTSVRELSPRSGRTRPGRSAARATSCTSPFSIRNSSTWSSVERPAVALAARAIQRRGAVVRREHVDQGRGVGAVRSPSAAGRGRRKICLPAGEGPCTSSRSRARSRSRRRRRRCAGRTRASRANASKMRRTSASFSARAIFAAPPPSGRSGPRRDGAALRRSRTGGAVVAPRSDRRSQPPPRAARAPASAAAAACGASGEGSRSPGRPAAPSVPA